MAKTKTNPSPALDGLKTVRIDTLQPDPRNPRKHPERNLAAIRASIERFGQVMPVVVRQGVVVGGNGLVTAMQQLGWTTCRIVELDKLSDVDAKMLRIALNRSAELAEWDYEVLSEDFKELIGTGVLSLEELSNWGWEKFEIDPLLNANWLPSADAAAGALGGERVVAAPTANELSQAVELSRLQARVAELEAENAELKAEVARLRREVDSYVSATEYGQQQA